MDVMGSTKDNLETGLGMVMAKCITRSSVRDVTIWMNIKAFITVNGKMICVMARVP